MGDLPGSFSESVRVRTKHAEKARVGLWGWSAIQKVVCDVTSIPLLLKVCANFCLVVHLHENIKAKEPTQIGTGENRN